MSHLALRSLLAIAIVSAIAIFQPPTKVTLIPISLTDCSQPCIIGQSENMNFPIILDLGSGFPLTLNREILEKLTDIHPRKKIKSKDIQGNLYESDSYFIPKMNINGLIWKNVLTIEEDEEYNENTTLIGQATSSSKGAIGNPLLIKTNLLLSIRDSILIACNDRRQFKKLGFSIEEMVCIPFKMGKKPILILEAIAEIGTLRLLLDTGATFNMLRTSRVAEKPLLAENFHGFPLITCEKFSMKGHDFGENKFLLYDIDPSLEEIDGILGMDFIEKHIMYIDYPNRKVYFSK